jgi:hypothetical protein
MVLHLKTNLSLAWTGGDEYDATVTVQIIGTGYSSGVLHPGLPKGTFGIPEEVYLTAEFTHEDQERSGNIVYPVTLKYDGIHSVGKFGATVFVTVNGEIAGSDSSHWFPKAKDLVPASSGGEIPTPFGTGAPS